jgi:hypothetical protein
MRPENISSQRMCLPTEVIQLCTRVADDFAGVSADSDLPLTELLPWDSLARRGGVQLVSVRRSTRLRTFFTVDQDLR